MMPNDRSKAQARRRALPAVVRLEGRLLLSAIPAPRGLVAEATHIRHAEHVAAVREAAFSK